MYTLRTVIGALRTGLNTLAGIADDPTGTAPDSLTFCTLGPAATMVVSCTIGNTVDMFHSRGSTAGDHVVDGLGAVERGVDVRLDAAIADSGEVRCQIRCGVGDWLCRAVPRWAVPAIRSAGRWSVTSVSHSARYHA